MIQRLEGSLPYRQLRNSTDCNAGPIICSLPYRQLRNAFTVNCLTPVRSLPYRQLRKIGIDASTFGVQFTAV